MQRVTFTNSRNLTLVGNLYPSQTDTASRPCISISAAAVRVMTIC